MVGKQEDHECSEREAGLQGLREELIFEKCRELAVKQAETAPLPDE